MFDIESHDGEKSKVFRELPTPVHKVHVYINTRLHGGPRKLVLQDELGYYS